MPNAVYLSPVDNVVTVTREIPSGGSISWLSNEQEHTVTASQTIPLYHKAATAPIPAGSPVYKYGQPIGVALTDIKAGDHVHTHNLASAPDTDRQDGSRTDASAAAPEQGPSGTSRPKSATDPEQIPTFQGYRRSDGRAGIRNHVLEIGRASCRERV